MTETREEYIVFLEEMIRAARACLVEADSDQAQNQAASYLDLAVPYDPTWTLDQMVSWPETAVSEEVTP